MTTYRRTLPPAARRTVVPGPAPDSGVRLRSQPSPPAEIELPAEFAPPRRSYKRWLSGLAVACATASGLAAFQANTTDVAVKRVVRGKAVDAAYATGTVEARERVDIKAQIGGTVSQIAVRTGQSVKRGDVLARLSNPVVGYELRRGRAERSAAAAHYGKSSPQLAILEAEGQAVLMERDSAQQDFERISRLQQTGANTDQDLERARTRATRAQAALSANEAQKRALRIDLRTDSVRQSANLGALKSRADDTIVRAPYDGVVLRRLVNLGELVAPNQTLFRIGDNTGVVLEVLVDEADVAPISDGSDGRARSRVAAALHAFPDRVFNGHVVELGPDADRDRKAFLAKIALDDPPPGLRSGMSAEVNIIRHERDNALLVPVEAVDDNKVWIVNADRAEPRWVQLGLRDLLRVEVLSGLSEGELVVVDGQAGLESGARVAGSLQPDDKLAVPPDTSQPSQRVF